MWSNPSQRIELQTRNDKRERMIQVLRYVSSIFITVSLTSFSIYLGVLTHKEYSVVEDDHKEFNKKM